MLESQAKVDEILTRRGIARLDRERILGQIDDGLAGRLIQAAPEEVEGLLREHYAKQKASVDDVEASDVEE